MSRIIDNFIAFRIIQKLVRPFEETDAFKLGIIDAKGHNLIKPSKFTTSEQGEAYTYLDRLVFNMKKIINKLPGGENKLKSIITALYLIKEYYEKNDRQLSLMEQKFEDLMKTNAILVEETIMVEKYLKDLEEDGGMSAGGAGVSIANIAGSQVSTDIAVPKKKDIDKYKMKNKNGVVAFARRPKQVE